jgi:hypothetical protein
MIPDGKGFKLICGFWAPCEKKGPLVKKLLEKRKKNQK